MVRKMNVCFTLLLTAGVFLMPGFAGKNAPSPVSVAVDVDIAGSYGDMVSSYNIRSDGQGIYRPGIDISSASLNSGGNIVISFSPLVDRQGNLISNPRSVYFSFRYPVQLDPNEYSECAVDTPMGTCGDAQPFDPNTTGLITSQYGKFAVPITMATLPIDINAYKPLQNLSSGESELVRLYWNFKYAGINENYIWRLGFRYGLGDIEPASYGKVTCQSAISGHCNIWTVQPENPSYALLSTSEGPAPQQFYSMPFLVTLRAR
jgi:hypothetical protein